MGDLDNKVLETGMQEKEDVALVEGSDDLEKSKILKMRCIVEREEPSSKVLPFIPSFSKKIVRRFFIFTTLLWLSCAGL